MNKKAQVNALPVKRIFLESIQLPIVRFRSLLRVGAPLLSLLIITMLIGQSGIIELQQEAGLFIVMGLVFLFLAVLTATMAVVGCHRIFLMDEKDIMATATVRWDERESRFLGWWIGIGILASLVILPLMLALMPLYNSFVEYNELMTELLMAVLILPVYYFISRWSLLLPATAVDTRHDLSWSWKISRGNGLRLTVLIGVIPFLTSMAFDLLPESESVIQMSLLGSVWLVVAVFEICLLSLSYQWLIKHNTQDELKGSE